jgi:uncharacterized membrane protein YqjE
VLSTVNGQSIGDLVKGLKDDATHLVQQEVELAKVELKNKTKQVAKDSSLLAAGLVCGWFALMGIVAAASIALIMLLDRVLEIEFGVAVWLGPLIVALALAGAGAALIATGRKRLEERDLKPRATVQSLQEDKEWIREKITT